MKYSPSEEKAHNGPPKHKARKRPTGGKPQMNAPSDMPRGPGGPPPGRGPASRGMSDMMKRIHGGE